MKNFPLRKIVLVTFGLVLAACSGTSPEETIGVPKNYPEYGEVQEGYITIAAIDPRYLQEPNRRTYVNYYGDETPGTIIVDPHAKFLFFVDGFGGAIRYPIAVGREGRGFKGQATIGRKAEWPGWTPTTNMLRSEPEVYGPFARGIPGGKASPLGARALYLYRDGRDTYFRIHGTNDPATIGNQGSAGCIRMFNQDVIDLYARVAVGAKVIVRTYEQSVAAEGFEMANRGGEMVPRSIDPVALYAFVAEEERRKAEYEASY
ncbi:L,D-transpeptidase [Ovoidimarina sediminis]|uniref:L,D-transpeptidase n=1 Tax=Ovoidimarina sediminis TaxID=3079856 RepID=UPI002910240F|nr:L,D-transpeptidase [Rhodophyticola sp. MJ-SS7]MDU8944261.1 L,D-transpeptidase [Rhodophyticola sp. MJ-SS7]